LKIIIIAVLLAGMFVGFYAALPHVPELQKMFHISGESGTEGQASDAPVPVQQPSNSAPTAPNSGTTDVGSLTIAGAGMYYHEPSFVIVKNSGTDAVLVQAVSYGQTTTPISNLRVDAGAQQHIPVPQASGVPGSSYLLQVRGISATSGKSVTAQASVILNEPTSRLDVSNVQINVAGGNSILHLTVNNPGGSPITIVSIECGAVIPTHLWGENGQVILEPGQYKQFEIQLDSTECSGANPQNGSSRNVTVRGENSMGKAVTAVAESIMVVEVQQVAPEPEAGTTQLVGTKLPMGQAVIRVQSAGHYVLSFEVVNTHYQDVRIDSLKVNGAEIPGWGGSVLLAQTSTMSTVTTSQGITSADIGSVAEVIILAHLSTSTQYGDPATSFYAVASAPVLGP
jgi:hypothetical protein